MNHESSSVLGFKTGTEKECGLFGTPYSCNVLIHTPRQLLKLFHFHYGLNKDFHAPTMLLESYRFAIVSTAVKATYMF